MAQFFKRILLLTTVFVFLFGLSADTRSADFSIGWLYDTVPDYNVRVNNAFLSGTVSGISQYGTVEIYIYVFGADGELKTSVQPVSISDIADRTTHVLTQDGPFSLVIENLYPDMDYYAVLYWKGAGMMGSVEVPTKLFFRTQPATSDDEIRNEHMAFGFTPINITKNSATLKGRLEGLRSGDSADYNFEWRIVADPTGVIYPENKILKVKTGSGWVPEETVSGLMADTDYAVRLRSVYNGSIYHSSWMTFRTLDEASPDTASFYYCKDDGNSCEAASFYTGDDKDACTYILQSVDGYSSKECYAASELNQCNSACESATERQFYYCQTSGEECVLTTESFLSAEICKEQFLTPTQGVLAGICYERSDKESCNTACKDESYYFYYCADSSSCDVTNNKYATREECQTAVNATQYAGRPCYYAFEKSTCDSKCAIINPGGSTGSTVIASAGGGGGGGAIGGKGVTASYYFCAKNNSQCIAVEKESLAACNQYLKDRFGNNTTRKCYVKKDKDNCNDACQNLLGKRYWFCMTDTGRCFQTGSAKKNKDICQTYVMGKYLSRTTGYCYDTNAECQSDCMMAYQQPVTPPVIETTPVTPPTDTTKPSNKMYVCIKSNQKCEVTYQFADSSAKCSEAIAEDMPGRTTNKCYRNIEDCTQDCDNLSNIDTAIVGFDWRDSKGSSWVSKVKTQGMCIGSWPFSMNMVIETKYNIENDIPDLDLDLSEQYLTTCLEQGNCSNGGPGADILNIARDGIVRESCLPYTKANWRQGEEQGSCEKCSDWSYDLWRIDDVTYLENPTTEEIKEQLKLHGPLITSYFAGGKVGGEYIGPIYSDEYARCGKAGNNNHLVVVIGYDEEKGYWVARNSWGRNWPKIQGEGDFKIGFGECGIFSEGAYYLTGIQTP